MLALAAGAGAGIAVLAGVLVYHRVVLRDRLRLRAPQAGPELVILFRDNLVVDATPDAAFVLGRSDLNGLDWVDLREILQERFPDLPEDAPDDALRLTARDDPDTILSLSGRRSNLRVSLQSRPVSPGRLYRLHMQQVEFDRLRDVMGMTPMPIWHMDAKGQVDWSNDAYQSLCDETDNQLVGDCPFDLSPNLTREARASRASLPAPGGKTRWFEVTSQPDKDGWMHFANSIDTLVEAEMAQRNFVQTLTKTFAHLPIGLAVFDRNRRLVLFNPALVDLTDLPVDFLSAKPNLLSFFDHMRENRLMPEPKNYASWREKLTDVVSAAREDRYSEIWTLPSGLTYKITGRPHPDGAVAFLLEDISAEISLTRHFRSELELTQSVIDCFEDSVAVFSRLGVLTFSNVAYRERWKCDPDSAFAEITIVDSTRDWQNGCEPSPIWAEIRDFVLTLRERSCWDAELVTREGERLLCIIEPVAAGATMIRFGRVAPRVRTAERVRVASH